MSVTETKIQKPRIAIVTLCIGSDYRRAMAPGLESKRAYAERYGYDCIVGGDEFWDREKPIPWSKIPFFLSLLDSYDWLWFSDADSIITNPSIRLEELIEKCFGSGSDSGNQDTEAVWWRDGCGNINSGQILAKGGGVTVKRWLQETGKQTHLLYHPWWENAGMIKVWDSDTEIQRRIPIRDDYRLLNAYLFPTEGRESWMPGDFCLHFAGVYDGPNIHRLMRYVSLCLERGTPIDMAQIVAWLKAPPASVSAAEKEVLTI